MSDSLYPPAVAQRLKGAGFYPHEDPNRQGLRVSGTKTTKGWTRVSILVDYAPTFQRALAEDLHGHLVQLAPDLGADVEADWDAYTLYLVASK